MPPVDHQDTIAPKLCSWRVKSGSTTPWEVTFPRERGQKRPQRRYFATEEEAKTDLEKWVKDRKPEASLGKRDLDLLRECKAMLPEGISLYDVVRDYCRRHQFSSDATFSDAVGNYKRSLKDASKAYKDETERILDLATAYFKGDTRLSSLTKGLLTRWIKEGDTYWVRYGRRRALSVVFSMAFDDGLVTENPVREVNIGEPKNKTIHFLGLPDLQTIMDDVVQHAPELAPVFALQAFAGIRTEELNRADEGGARRALRWEDISWEKKITVPAEVSKMGERAIVDFWPKALTNFLTHYRQLAGRIWDDKNGDLKDAKRRYFESLNTRLIADKRTAVDYRQNDFRHTYATYLCSYFENTGRVQLLMRQRDSDVLHTNYKGLIEDDDAKEQAERFVSMAPTVKCMLERAA